MKSSCAVPSIRWSAAGVLECMFDASVLLGRFNEEGAEEAGRFGVKGLA